MGAVASQTTGVSVVYSTVCSGGGQRKHQSSASLAFVRRIHRSPVNSPHKNQWRGALMFSLICALNKWLSKQWWGGWFKTPSRPLWRPCNELQSPYNLTMHKVCGPSNSCPATWPIEKHGVSCNGCFVWTKWIYFNVRMDNEIQLIKTCHSREGDSRWPAFGESWVSTYKCANYITIHGRKFSRECCMSARIITISAAVAAQGRVIFNCRYHDLNGSLWSGHVYISSDNGFTPILHQNHFQNKYCLFLFCLFWYRARRSGCHLACKT